MERRNLMLTLPGVMAAAAFVALPRHAAVAQTATPKTLGLSQYKTRTLNVGTLSKQSSQLAIAQASNPKVKEFAQFEFNEQTTIAQVLTNLANPPPAPLNAQQTAMMRQLQGQSGKSFDMAYVQGQVSGHQELLGIQQAYLNGAPIDFDDRHIAMLSRTVIQMHLTMLQDLQNQMAA